MAGKRLGRGLSTTEGLPERAVERAVTLMRRGALFRYGEDVEGEAEAALLEAEFAAYMDARYCAAVNSGGCALFVALKAIGIEPGEKVLLNAFTLAPVPGAVAHAGGEPVMVEIGPDLTVDIGDLERKAARSGARVLLLSHMRGHIADMEAVLGVCERHAITLVEDCAHTLGARWDGALSGSFGRVACFSAQTFKHLNAGEGGLLTTDDADIAARAILLSGSYMFYRQHGARPGDEVFERHRWTTPNCSMRMSALAAALLRPQLADLDARCRRWNEAYGRLVGELARVPRIVLPARDPREGFVGSSLQFSLTGLDGDGVGRFLAECDARGVHVKWFGQREPVGFTSRHASWRYIAAPAVLPRTDAVLDALCDMRVPIDLTAEEARLIATIFREALERARDESGAERRSA